MLSFNSWLFTATGSPKDLHTLNSIQSLTGSHLRTYESIVQHPVSHNLEWRNVRSLFNHIAEVVEQPNGNLKVTRNGQSMILRTPRTKDVAEVAELMELRHFLARSEAAPLQPVAGEAHWLVVIDHHEARIYKSEMSGTVPERILPHEPSEFFRHAHNSKDFTRGREKPDPNSFFEPVTAALKAAGKILLFGTGKGTSSEMEQFVAWLKKHHADVSSRVVGSIAIDESHLSDAQLLLKAREFYSTAAV
jgi:hypothetical protein